MNNKKNWAAIVAASMAAPGCDDRLLPPPSGNSHQDALRDNSPGSGVYHVTTIFNIDNREFMEMAQASPERGVSALRGRFEGTTKFGSEGLDNWLSTFNGGQWKDLETAPILYQATGAIEANNPAAAVTALTKLDKNMGTLVENLSRLKPEDKPSADIIAEISELQSITQFVRSGIEKGPTAVAAKPLSR